MFDDGIYTQQKKAEVFGKWEVRKNGDMIYDKGRYAIYSTQISNDDWLLHIYEKKWNDFNEFIPAYLQALRNAGIKKLEMKIFY